MNSRFIIPVFVPHKGCPNDCVFCNQKKITGQKTQYNFDKVNKEMQKAISTIEFDKKPIVEIAFYGGTFTAIDLKDQIKFLKIANKYIDKYPIKGIRLSTRPDSINIEILEMLKKFNVKRIELGVQSLSNKVLNMSNRGHNEKEVYKACDLIKKYDFELGIQLMIGLPGDSYKEAIKTVKKVIKINPEFVRIYPTLIIKETELEKLYNNNKYRPLNLDEAVDLSTDMYHLFFKNNIDVIRIGLQPTKNIMEGEDVVAGPFHSSFRQLVISRYILKLIEQKINMENIRQIKFELNPKDISYLVGNKKSNKIYLNKKYNIENFKIISDKSIRRGKLKIFNKEINETIYFS